MSEATTIPEENCAHCAKVISRKARANVLDGEILCTACYNRACDKRRREEEKAQRQAHAAQDAQAVANEPPTERQLAFAQELGIAVPRGATKWSLSARITEVLDARREREEDDSPPRVVYVPARPRKKAKSGLGCVAGAIIILAGTIAGLCLLMARK